MKRRSGTVAATCATLVLLLAGISCSQAVPNPTATSAPPTATVSSSAPATAATKPATPAPTAVQPAATAAAKPAPTGVIRIGASEWGAEGFDPYAVGHTDNGQMELVFDWLVGSAPDKKDISKETGLASSWETSPDGLVWTFYLRKGVKFDQNYGEATADDVKFSIERMWRDGTKASFSPSLKAGTKAIDVVNPGTIRFTLNKPIVTLAYDLSPMLGTEGIIVPKKYVEKVGDQEFNTHPIGSGPYRLTSQTKGLSMTFEARDDFWGGTPKYKQVVLNTVPELGTRVANLKTGQLDIANVDISSLKDLQASGFKVTERPGSLSVTGILLDQGKGALADVKVRRAINLAINKQELLGLFDGRGQVLPQGVAINWAVGAKTFDPAPYDPNLAKDLLKQAGYATGLELTLDVIPNIPAPVVSQALSGYLEKVGIKSKLTNWEYAAWLSWYSSADKDHTNHLTVFPFGNRLFGLGFYQAVFSSSGIFAAANLHSSEYDAHVAKGQSATDLGQVATAVGNLQQYLHDNWITADMIQIGDYWASSSKIDTTGWTAGGRAPFKGVVEELVMGR